MLSNFKPTFLYIKQHTVTGKMYFGKTGKNNPNYGKKETTRSIRQNESYTRKKQ